MHYWLILILGVISSAFGSIGDRQPKFRKCIRSCIESNKFKSVFTFWNEEDECKYECMHKIVDEIQLNWVQEPIRQYYGKWPFYRFLGIQEPFSTLFSVLNLLAHRYGLRDIKLRLDRHPNKSAYLLFSYINILAWIASTIFHTRDTKLTERLDYIFAGAAVFSGLNLALIRVLNVKSNKSSTILSTIYFFHVFSTLISTRIDYSWNMLVIVTAGMIHNLIWIYFSFKIIKSSSSFKHPAPFTPIILVILTMLALSLELTEFEPLFRSIDAHSLWHAATFPLSIHWYSFLIRDAEWQIQMKDYRLNKHLDA